MHDALRCLLLYLILLPGACAGQDPAPAVSLREQAYGAENRGDFSAAADAFLKLVEQEPHNPKWIVNAGDCLGRSGRFAAAIDLLDAARAEFPGVIEIPAMLARTLLLKAERDDGALNPQSLRTQAAEIAEGVLQLYPDHEDSRLVLAQARYMLGEWDEAVRQAEEAVRRHPDRAGAHILLGRIATDRMRDWLRLHETDALSGQELADLVAKIDRERKLAHRAFERAAELDPSRAHPHMMLARIALFDGKDERVRQHLLDALAIDPDLSIDHDRITKGLDWQQRQKTYAECHRRYAARSDARADKAATLRWFEGKALFDGQQWQAAREAFAEVLAANPEAINSHYYAALCAFELEDHDDAEKHAGDYAATSALGFADVVQHLDGDARGQVAAIVKYLADRAYQRGNIARSRDLNHVVALLYDTVDAWNNRAFLCRETERFEDALSAYQRALEKQPDSPQLLNDTAVILHYHLPNPENLARARTLYTRAIDSAKALIAADDTSVADKQQALRSLADANKNLAAMK